MRLRLSLSFLCIALVLLPISEGRARGTTLANPGALQTFASTHRAALAADRLAVSMPITRTVTMRPGAGASQILVAPSNDDIATPIVITSLPYTNTQDTTDATSLGDPVTCGYSLGDAHSVWYRIMPSLSGTLLAGTLGSDYDTVLSVFTGAPGSLTLLACNDDWGGVRQSSVKFTVTAVTTYYLEVASYDSYAAGSLALTVSQLVPRAYLPIVTRNFPARIPNDPYYSSWQWNMDRVGAPLAWYYSNGSGVIIAVADTGVDLSHPDLAGKIVSGWDFVNGDSVPQDDNGHGTHVAGIAAAVTNNGVGVAGLGWDAQVMPVKVLDWAGSGWISDIANGIRWAADNGADVINLSLGGPGYDSTLDQATTYAHGKGALVVAAAGNCATVSNSCGNQLNPVFYPAANLYVMAVAATDSTDARTNYSEYGYFVDIAAPGDEIWSTLWANTYGYKSGTSMASPHVAGLAALVWAACPALTNDQVASVIESNALDLGAPGWDEYYGYGRIRADAAVVNCGSGAMSQLRQKPAPTRQPPPADAPVRPGVVLARFRPSAQAADRQALLARHGAAISGQLGALDILRLNVPAGRERDIAASLMQDPSVEFAEPDYMVHFVR